MSIASVIDLGIGPGAKIRFVITGGFGLASGAGAISAAITGKKKKDTRQWFTLPNGMRILATPENYARFARKYPKLEETPADPALPEEAREGVAIAVSSAFPAEVQPEPVAEEKYDGPLLGIAPKSEIEIPQAESDLRASLAAAEKLEAERLAREIEEEDDAIVLEILLKDMAA